MADNHKHSDSEHSHEHESERPAKAEKSHGDAAHGHTHGAIDPSIVTTSKGLWAVKWSFVALTATALFQVVIVLVSGSVALFADTIHNFGDAATAIPLGIAFLLARRKPSKRFSYGLGRAEDVAGVIVVGLILLSAVVAGYESVLRLFDPQPVSLIWAVALASIMGFIGNEGVAIFRLRVGKEIGSAALIADGYHARTDGWTSLAVLIGAIGSWLGFPILDPLIGLFITLAILRIVWESGANIFARLLDGVEPGVIDELQHAAGHVNGVTEVSQVRARWAGHRLYAEVNVAVDPKSSIVESHAIATEVRHQLLHHLPHLGNAVVHVDPQHASGEEHHQRIQHVHDGLPVHSHA